MFAFGFVIGACAVIAVWRSVALYHYGFHKDRL
jgi:hypothetical protein